MDEDDSQDELINRNVSYGKGKRPAMSIVSDDDDNSEGEGASEEAETDSEEDAYEEEGLDGEEEEDGEEDDSEDEDSGKVLEGAEGNAPTNTVYLSSDEESEKCPICLNSFHEQPVATPQACDHYFCLDCILEWSKNANSCPVDRKVFNNILLRKCYGGKVQKTIAVQKPVKPEKEEQVDVDLDQTCCEVCGGRDREDRLLLCDGCDAGYHMECLTPPLDAVPVEEWFCPECTANNRSSGSDQVSEEDSTSLPTTSRTQSRPTRAIARTQHSERVRANVNRHRITQARTAAQLAPRYLMQSTWLDETINAVVAGLNSAVYVRDLTPRAKSYRRRRTAKKRKTKGKSSAAAGGKTNLGVRRRKRKVRRSKSRRKLVVKKGTNSRGRIAKSLGIKKPKTGSNIPSVYRPSESSLGSMRAEIGAASLSVYGDPFDLDPFDDREDEVQVPTPPSVLDAKRRGLSRSALRSHQPVARPITAGLSRHGGSIPQAGEVAAEPDLLGSILSGQNMLLMDSSDVVINRDGSLKASKPVSLSLQRSTTPRGSSSGEAENSEASPFQSIGAAGPSYSPLRRPPSAHSSPGSCCTPQIPTSPCPPIPSPHLPYSHPPPMGHPRLHPGLPSRPVALNPQRPGNGIRGQPLSRESNSVSDPQRQDKGSTSRQPPVKKPPPKPVWVDVSVLPRIPKIKKEGTSNTNNSRGSSSSSLPESSATSLAGNTGREHTVDQQGTNNSHSNRTMDSQTQRSDRTGASSTFSSSFTSTTSSIDASSNSRPSSSSVSFRISSSGNPWHARRLSASGGTLPGNKETVRRNDKSKRMLLSLRSKAEEIKSDTYDPFNPTGSDSSDNESESERPNASTQNTESRVLVEPNEDDCHPIKSEPVDVDSESGSEMCPLVKTGTDSFSDKPWKRSPRQSDTVQNPTSSKGPVVDCSSSDAWLDGGTQESLLEMMSNVKNFKVEIKSEPEAGPSPVRPHSKSLDEEFLLDLQQSSKGNGLCKELPGVSDPTNVPKEEKRSHKSKSKDIRRSPSNSPSPSKDAHKKKRSKDKKRSRSKSRDRLHSKSKDSRTRSKERKRRRSRDRRYSSSSSSRERKTSRKRESRERSDSRGRDRQRKRSKEKRFSQSHSFSRSRSRDRSRVTNDHMERFKKRKSRSRSTSKERKKRDDRSESHQHKEKISSKTTSAELYEPAANKTSTSLKKEKDSRTLESKSSFPSVKQEVSTPTHGLGSSGHDDQTRTLAENKKDVLIELKMLKPEEMKQEKLTHGGIKESKDIKKEEELYACKEFESELELDTVKKEMVSSSDIFSEESPEPSETKLDTVDLGTSQACNPDDEMKETVVGPKTIKTEQIWPDEDDSPCCSDNPLVISLDTPDVENCKKETESNRSPLMDEMELTPAQPADPIKQEDLNSSDEDISVDYLIDNLDFIKKEMSESSVADSTDAVHPKSGAEDAHSDNKTGTESTAGSVKSKSQGKRVTWNLQEPEGPQSDKLSKLALFKLKLKQDASRRSSAVQQTSSQDKAQAEAKLTADVSSPLSQDESSRRKSRKEEVLQDPHQKEKYMKKLHMQERAIEEVKLAIKPFYQKRDITKDEYKEILRKAVQKVCHSKSGEINPVKVANLVKAYVDKYKHARKHKKDDGVQSQHTDTKDFKTSA